MRNKRGAVVFFCRLLLSPIASTFGSGVPYTARTFLSRQAPAADRSTLSGDKGSAKNRISKENAKKMFYSSRRNREAPYLFILRDGIVKHRIRRGWR